MKKQPFFARFLESQKVEAEKIHGGLPFSTDKWPSDTDEDVTHKWPSDDDEDWANS